ncbi:hypothetical protein KY284_032897 [Solanum tuberosum]|nr:hypothetical protein KY284_032897 [Solanum tuberosum]
MNLPKFHGSKVIEDPQKFIEGIQMNIEIIGVTSIERQVQGAFLDRFFPLDMREEEVQEFINSRQRNMSMKEYTMKFTQLSKYASAIVFDSRAQMSKFVSAVSEMVVKTQQDHEVSTNVFTGMLRVFQYALYALLDLGTTLYFVTPYISMKMAPAELKKLKDQLRDLLDKGFIRLFKQYLDVFIIVFINDILIYSWSENEHANHLRIVLQVLKDRKLFAKFRKGEFWLRSVAFIGHIVSKEGIQVDPTKTDVVKNKPRPLSTSNIQSFLGLANNYIWFVERFSSIAYPLTTLTQKKVKFQWSKDCEKSFQELNI